MLDARLAMLTVLAVGTSLLLSGCSQAPLTAPESSISTTVESEASEIQAPDAKILFDKSNVVTVAAPPPIVVRKRSEAPVASEEVATPETVQQDAIPVATAPVPVQVVLAPSPTPVQAVKATAPVQKIEQPVAAPAPETRYVHVGLSGGQNVVDLERGPVLFPLPAGFPPYVAEHDFSGGWARFGSLSVGMRVSMSGLIGGTYTVGQIISVPKNGHTEDLRAFTATPKVMLQTCVPGTNRMIVVGLY